MDISQLYHLAKACWPPLCIPLSQEYIVIDMYNDTKGGQVTKLC